MFNIKTLLMKRLFLILFLYENKIQDIRIIKKYILWNDFRFAAVDLFFAIN